MTDHEALKKLVEYIADVGLGVRTPDEVVDLAKTTADTRGWPLAGLRTPMMWGCRPLGPLDTQLAFPGAV
jgi:hypothetical protein